MNPTIALMTEEDVDAVCEIEQQVFSTPWSKRSFLHDLRGNECARWLCLKLDGELAAYAGMWLVLNEAHITNVAVKPSLQRMGYGEAIMTALIQLAADSGMTWMTLEVRRSNERAQSLYRKLGFVEIGCRKGYYENREDAILMALEELPEGDCERDPFLVRE